MDKSVHIIILNWNGYLLTRDCLISLRNIDYKNHRITVVDNASTDDSVDKLSKEFPEIELLRSNVNLGFAGGNNLALKYVKEMYKPDYFLLLNNDTAVEPSFLSALVKNSTDLSVGIIGSKIYFFDEPTRLWFAGGYFDRFSGDGRHYAYEQLDEGGNNKLCKVDFITGCCLMITKQLIEKIGYLDDSFFAYCEDLDYCLRAKKNGFDCLYVPDSIIYHKVSSSFKTQKTTTLGARSALAYYLNVRNRFFIYRKHRELINTVGFIYSQFLFVMRYLIGFSVTFQFEKFKNVISGVRDGVFMKLKK